MGNRINELKNPKNVERRAASAMFSADELDRVDALLAYVGGNRSDLIHGAVMDAVDDLEKHFQGKAPPSPKTKPEKKEQPKK